MSCLQTMEVFKNDISSFKKFLTDFCKDHNGQITEDDPLPFRLLNYYLTEEEVEAEVLEWSMQYLTANQCPNLLACLLARRVADEVLTWDLSKYIEPVTPSVEDVCDGLQLQDSPRDNTPQIEVTKLARVVFSKVHDLCAEFQGDFPDNLRVPNRAACVSYHAIKNVRRKMEDKHVTLPYINYLFNLEESCSPASYYAVFDGHAGVDAAVYAATHLHRNILCHSAYNNQLSTAIHDAIEKTDTDFCKKAERESLRSGSTGVFVLLRENKLHICWIGDSQAMMVRDGEPVCLMEPHKPEREDERKRIEELGGCVIQLEGAWRVNGTLSVSRAFGDIHYRPYICASADMRTYDLDGTEDYIVLACDGLWDTVSHDMVVSTVYDHLQEYPDDHAGVARRLVALARDRRSTDNISVIVVFLRDKVAIPGSRSEDRVRVGDEDVSMDESNEFSPHGFISSASSQPASKYGAKSQLNKDQCPDVSDSSSRAIKGRSSDSSANQISGNIIPGQSPASSSHQVGESPVLLKLKNAADTSSPELSNTNTGSKRVLVDLPLLEKLRISSSPNQSSPEPSSNTASTTTQQQQPPVPRAPLCVSEKSDLSETSSTDIAIMSTTASKCFNNRKAKRNKKSTRRKNLRDLRKGGGVSKESNKPSALISSPMGASRIIPLSSPLSPHSLSLPRSPLTSPSGGGTGVFARRTNQLKRRPSADTSSATASVAAFLRSSLVSPSSRGTVESPSSSTHHHHHLVEMLTGCSPSVNRKVREVARSRWTVAVEIESGSGIFGE